MSCIDVNFLISWFYCSYIRECTCLQEIYTDIFGDKIIVLLTIDVYLRSEEIQSMTISMILETTLLKQSIYTDNNLKNIPRLLGLFFCNGEFILRKYNLCEIVFMQKEYSVCIVRNVLGLPFYIEKNDDTFQTQSSNTCH